MLTSRKIISVKTHSDSNRVYVRAFIRKSYGYDARPAILLFVGGTPLKGYCECPVGLSGLCCHVLAILLYLKHYVDTKTTILELTCTQVIQKWHKRSKKGSIPMVPLCHIKVKSARNKNKIENLKIAPADPESSSFKRDVLKMKQKIKEGLNKLPIFEKHVYDTLCSVDLGYESSLMGHLRFRYDRESFNSQVDKLSSINVKSRTLNKQIVNPQEYQENYNEIPTIMQILNQNIINIEVVSISPEQDIVLEKISMQILNEHPVIHINLKNMVPTQRQYTNHINVKQNTQEWMDTRKGKVTGSRLPALLGIYGQEKFANYWKIVKEGLNENDFYNTQNIKNFERGHKYEFMALQQFAKMSKCSPEMCGFFYHPDDLNYGASPDSLVSHQIILEIKTRAKNRDSPLIHLKNQPQYYVQAQLELLCTKSKYCILQSYHPETENSNYFIIQINYLLMSVIKEISDSILHSNPIKKWHHQEHSLLTTLGNNIVGKIPDFKELKPLRLYIKELVETSISPLKLV
nr:uncharacterized protein LOC124808932 [Hydra vulgaris]